MRPEDSELKQLLDQFVPVRIVNFKGVDMNRFRFDYDLTFAVLMMAPDGHVYSRFGTRDDHDGAGRMSIPGLKNAMKQALAMHKGRKPAPAAAPAATPFTLESIPAFRGTKASGEACYHCHYANNFRFKQLMAEGKFSKEMVYQYPLPETIGVSLELDRNDVVRQVLPGSPAEQAGLRVGDVLLEAEGRPVLTSADLQYVLNGIASPATVNLRASRAGKPVALKPLNLPAGWRRHDVSWRASQEVVPPSVGFWGKPLTAEEKSRRGIAPDRLGLLVNFLFPGSKGAQSRGDLRNNDVIVGLDGKDLPSMNTRQFHSHFRMTHNVGDKAVLHVLRGSQRLDIPVPCLDLGE